MSTNLRYWWLTLNSLNPVQQKTKQICYLFWSGYNGWTINIVQFAHLGRLIERILDLYCIVL